MARTSEEMNLQLQGSPYSNPFVSNTSTTDSVVGTSANAFITPITTMSASFNNMQTIDQVGSSITHVSPTNPFVSSNPFRSAYGLSSSDSLVTSTPLSAYPRPPPRTLFHQPTPPSLSGGLFGDAIPPLGPSPSGPLLASHAAAAAAATTNTAATAAIPAAATFSATPRRAPPPTRPTATLDMTPHALRKFITDWNIFKRLANIHQSDFTIELYMCCNEQLQSAIYANCARFIEMPETDLLQMINELISKPRNRAATRKNFQSLVQQPGERVTDYMTRILQAATDCCYSCPDCYRDLTDEHARDQLIIGLSNTALQKDVMCKDDLLPALSDVVRHCTAFEAATENQLAIHKENKTSVNSSVNAIMPKHNNTRRPPSAPASSDSRSTKPLVAEAPAKDEPTPRLRSTVSKKRDTTTCRGCGTSPPHYDRAKSCPAWGKACVKCGIMNHFQSVCMSSGDTSVAHLSWDPTLQSFQQSAPAPLQQIDTEI